MQGKIFFGIALMGVLGFWGCEQEEKASDIPPNTVLITDQGYKPKTLSIPFGKETTVTFKRTSQYSCGEELVIESLGIRKKLTLEEPIPIKFHPTKKEEITFTCAMGMMKGIIQVK